MLYSRFLVCSRDHTVHSLSKLFIAEWSESAKLTSFPAFLQMKTVQLVPSNTITKIVKDHTLTKKKYLTFIGSVIKKIRLIF
ncbi:unnamed protein product [Camellia sinensis]